jgi:acylphosphatase
MPSERRRVLFSGRVQGVGFRYTCRSLAQRFEVAGYVRNLPDGRVELVAEGDRSELDEFISAVRLEMSSYITEMHTELEPRSLERPEGFSIQF